jgi:hypothetical protein
MPELAQRLCDRHLTLADFQLTGQLALKEYDSRARLRRDIEAGGRRWQLASGRIDEQMKSLRPVNLELFVADTYEETFTETVELLRAIRRRTADQETLACSRERLLISRTLYTTVQAIGCAMDLHLPPQQARKQLGSRFEDLISAVCDAVGVGHRAMSANVPYALDDGLEASYRPQIDRVLWPSARPRTGKALADDEVICSVKTSSKDRFAKIFSDRHVLDHLRGVGTPAIALFHNDVQRVRDDRIATTFVPHNFLAYLKTYGPLSGVYYLDPPPHARLAPWSEYLRTFDDWLCTDIWRILSPDDR